MGKQRQRCQQIVHHIGLHHMCYPLPGHNHETPMEEKIAREWSGLTLSDPKGDSSAPATNPHDPMQQTIADTLCHNASDRDAAVSSTGIHYAACFRTNKPDNPTLKYSCTILISNTTSACLTTKEPSGRPIAEETCPKQSSGQINHNWEGCTMLVRHKTISTKI